MKLATFLSILLLLTGASALAPTAAAHVCGNASSPGGSASGSVDENGQATGSSGSNGDWESECGPCVDGEDHVHGSAQSDGADSGAQGCVSSRHFVPAPTLAPLLAGLLGAALAFAHVRGARRA